jgi:hypothetical protein
MVLAMLSTASGSALAQVYGIWSNPMHQEVGTYLASGHLLVGDLTGFMGQFRTGVGEKVDIGARLGLPDFDFDFGFGADVRYQIMPESETFPMNLAADAGFGWATVGEGDADLTFFDIVFGVIGSREVTTQTGFVLVPYATFLFDIKRVSADVGQFDASDTQFGVHFGFGTDIPVNEMISVNGEIGIVTNGGAAFGVQGTNAVVDSDTAFFAVFGAGYHF